MNLQGIIQNIEKKHLRNNVADIRVGETIRVHYKIREGNKERAQVFEGLVVATKGGRSLQGSFTVRKVSSGVGVERSFPLHSPWIMKIERVKTGKVRRAKLNFVRKYAMSSRFKLKDKGVEGTVWEEIAAQKEDITEGESAQQSAEPAPAIEEPAEKPEDNADANEAVGESGGEPGQAVSEESGSEDSPAKSSN
jgi:large subunit ribosomal protein L19